MANPSNLYAEKIFSEHPIALWALDDQVDFVSLINSNEKNFVGWETSANADILSFTTQSPYIPNQPMVSLLTLDDSPATATSQTPISGAALDQSKNTFNISTYFKGDIDAIVKLGYVYNSEYVYEQFDYTAQSDEAWALLSKSFSLPGDDDIFIKIEITQSVNLSNSFYFNNFSVGQWSERFVSKSSGVLLEELSSYRNINLPNVYAVPAKAYGLIENDAYYLASENRLYAYNDGFPMVYGASNTTRIEPTEDLPSLIIPGLGFLNDNGKYYDLTAEMWVRLDVVSDEPKRIFGPISSSDGLYVKGEFLVIRVGDNYGSYYVGEWGRPMLLHFRVSQNTASLLVDGEQAVSMTINTENIEMPKPYSSEEKEQDWLGFYSHENISIFEIDCVSIYSYQIPEIVAKRRFVYGQGVEFPELSSSSLISASAFIDYRSAGYANNFMYPDMARWSQAITDNLVVENKSIKTPKYTLPTILFNNPNADYSTWLAANSAAQPDDLGSVTLSLATSLSGSGGYIYFNNFNTISSKVHGVYGVFKNSLPSESDQVLFRVINKVSGDYFDASIINGSIVYTLKDDSSTNLVIDTLVNILENDTFVAGINIKALNQKYGGRVSKFFGASKNLAVYVAGYPSNSDLTFYGDVYRFGFMTERNVNKVIDYFSDSDTHITGTDGELFAVMANHIASYTLKPSIYIDSFILDIATDSYWQDYVPISRLAGSALNADGEYDRKISFVQFNLDAPIIKQITGGFYNTLPNKVKAYISFQYLSAKPNADKTSFTYSQPLSESKTVIPGSNWFQTIYEVNDDTVIYLPTDANYTKIALVLHLEIEADNTVNEQVKIKSLQLASQALSDVEPKTITTRFGDTLFAYTLRGIYPDYSSRNPVSIYKGSTPYMYLTNSSGIKLVGTLNDEKQRGIRYLLNKQASNLYRIGASQILAKYYEDTFSTIPKRIMTFKGYVVQNLQRQERIISIYVVSANEDNNRGKVYAIDEKTGLPDPTVYFYLNGNLVKDLYITPRSWNMIGLQFQVALDLNSSIGYMDISGPLLVHGISNYRLTSTQDSQSSILRSWSQVRTMLDKGGDATNWGDFLSSSPVISWQNILYIPTERSFLVDAALPFRIYTGTNKIIVGDTNKLRFTQYQYKTYQDIVWQSSIFDAV